VYILTSSLLILFKFMKVAIFSACFLVLQQIKDMGNDGITGAHNTITSTLDYRKLPDLLPGFRFIESPCDPCVAIDSVPKYTCPFSLTSRDPSPIWSSLWGLPNSAKKIIEHVREDPKAFPLLAQLKNELNTLMPETGIKPKQSAQKGPLPASSRAPPPPKPATKNSKSSKPAQTKAVASKTQQKTNAELSKLKKSLSKTLNK
jgi:hypothetical protein